MRPLRLSLVGTVMLALLGGLSVAVVAQDEAVQPAVEFSGRFVCTVDDQQGAMEAIFLGRFDEGSLIRREVRGSVMRTTVDEMSDPRLKGDWSTYVNTDEYIWVGTDSEPSPGLGTVVVRMENEEGAWQGSGSEPYLPGVPVPEWGMLVLVGEDAYEGLTAVMANHFVDEPCGWELRGYIVEGEMPPMPEPLEPLAE